jgi:formamidopyrimidine-DNA glycosylase
LPELPEVETTIRGITPHIQNHKIESVTVRQSKLRWLVTDTLVSAIQNQSIESISRRAKYIICKINNGHLLIHLGMSGCLRIHQGDAPQYEKHDHIELKFSNGCTLRYNDPRRFGFWLWTEEDLAKHPRLSHLGPEPLSTDFNAKHLLGCCKKRSVAIKGVIMEQKVVVGVGNIYANEALFLSSINPLKPANKLTLDDCKLICKNAKAVLKKSISQGGTTLRDFSQSDGKPGYFAQQLLVYARDSCQSCNNAITQIRIAGRNSFYCTNCQKL